MDDLLELTGRVEAAHFWFRGFRRFIQPIVDEVTAGRPGLRLLDCGCGTGHNLARLARAGRAYGFDLTEGGLALAKRRGVPLVRASVDRIPFRDATFDLLTSFDVLQYLEDDGQVLREMARVLRPGGHLVLTASAMAVLRGGHAGSWPEVRRYDRPRMRRIATAAGLEVQRVTHLFAALFPMMLVTRVLQRAAGRQPGAEEDWEMQVPPAPLNAALTAALALEATLARPFSMPCGSSLLLVARKPPAA